MLTEIKDIGACVWIDASAGTGKTKNLIDRIIALLLHGCVPSKIMCLTYTKAAASEMMNRLNTFVKELNEMNDTERCKFLSEHGFSEDCQSRIEEIFQLSLGDNWVKIQTIHSLAQKIVCAFPLESGIGSNFSVIESYKIDEMLQDAFYEILQNHNFDHFLRRISNYSLNIIDIIKNNKLDIANFISAHKSFDVLLSEFFEIEKDFLMLSDNEIEKCMVVRFFDDSTNEKLFEICKILKKGGVEDIKKSEIISSFLNNPSQDIIKVFLTEKLEMRARLASKKLLDQYPDLLSDMQGLSDLCLRFLDKKNSTIHAANSYAFFSVAIEVLEKYEKKKQDANFVDFDQLIEKCIFLLSKFNYAMYKMDSEIEHLLLDEAQDTSKDQWHIIKLLTDEFFDSIDKLKTIFVVGDRKQSIYSFQGADVQLFDAMREYFYQKCVFKNQRWHNVIIRHSYRSVNQVLTFVDKILGDQLHCKHVSNRGGSGVVEVWPMFSNDDVICDNCAESEQGDGQWKSEKIDFNFKTATQKLAIAITNKIKNCIEKNIFVPSRGRGIIPGDFMILFQRRNIDMVNYLSQALIRENIPTSCIDRMPLMKLICIQDVICLGEFVTFHYDDLNLARLLKSPFFNLSDYDLLEICTSDGDDIRESLFYKIGENSNSKWQEIYTQLQQFISNSNTMTLYDFFATTIYKFRKNFISRLGKVSQNYISDFLEIVKKYEKENISCMYDFCKWVKSNDMEIAINPDLKKNEVKIMTTHGAKGLQAPFVILADANFYRTKSDRIIKSCNGLLVWNASSTLRSSKMESIIEFSKHADFEESIRLMYVGLTRAEDFLIVAGTKTNNIHINSWYNVITKNLVVDLCEKDNIYKIGEYELAERQYENIPTVKKEIILPEFTNITLNVAKEILTNESAKSLEEIRGELIHKLLEEFPKYKTENLMKVGYFWAEQFNQDYNFSESDIDEIINLVISVITNVKFQFIFSSDGVSELLFVRRSGLQGRVDKIVIYKDTVFLIDFKTGLCSDNAKIKYVEQLRFYKNTAYEIFKNKYPIKCALLWVDLNKLEFIENLDQSTEITECYDYHII